MIYDDNKIEKLAKYLSVSTEELKTFLGLPTKIGLHKVRSIKVVKSIYKKALKENLELLRLAAFVKYEEMTQKQLLAAKTYSEVENLVIDGNSISECDRLVGYLEGEETYQLAKDRMRQLATTDGELMDALCEFELCCDYDSRCENHCENDFYGGFEEIVTIEDAESLTREYGIFHGINDWPRILLKRKVNRVIKASLANADFQQAQDIFADNNYRSWSPSIELKRAAAERMLELI